MSGSPRQLVTTRADISGSFSRREPCQRRSSRLVLSRLVSLAETRNCATCRLSQIDSKSLTAPAYAPVSHTLVLRLACRDRERRVDTFCQPDAYWWHYVSISGCGITLGHVVIWNERKEMSDNGNIIYLNGKIYGLIEDMYDNYKDMLTEFVWI